jgi:hypothetical protein
VAGVATGVAGVAGRAGVAGVATGVAGLAAAAAGVAAAAAGVAGAAPAWRGQRLAGLVPILATQGAVSMPFYSPVHRQNENLGRTRALCSLTGVEPLGSLNVAARACGARRHSRSRRRASAHRRTRYARSAGATA